MGKTDLLREVLETFKARVRIQIMQIKQHISVNNYHPILSEAHSIKGGAGNLGAFNLSKAAADLEQAAATGSTEQATAAVEDLQNEFYILYQYIEESKIGTPSQNENSNR
jgi:HPt (histidine-containing phosphotransfer) domain-containing protein